MMMHEYAQHCLLKEELKEEVKDATKPTLKTEDSGKIFEKAITLAFDIDSVFILFRYFSISKLVYLSFFSVL